MHDPAEDALMASLGAAAPGVSVVAVPPPRRLGALDILLGAITAQPIHAWRMRSSAFRNSIRDSVTSEGIDAIVVTYTFMCQYLDLIPRHCLQIVDTHNIDSVLMKRYLPQVKNT